MWSRLPGNPQSMGNMKKKFLLSYRHLGERSLESLAKEVVMEQSGKKHNLGLSENRKREIGYSRFLFRGLRGAIAGEGKWDHECFLKNDKYCLTSTDGKINHVRREERLWE